MMESKKRKIVLSRPPMRRAITGYCHECSGKNTVNKMFCHLFDCPLWYFRMSVSPESKAYEKKLRTQWENGEKGIEVEKEKGGNFTNLNQVADAVLHLKEMGFELDHFLGYKKSL